MNPLSIGLGAIGLGTQIFGAAKSGQANQEMADNIAQQEARAEAFYNNRVNKDFLETNAAKGIIEQLRQKYQDQVKQIDSTTAATGGTAEANIAAKTSANQQVNNAMNSVAQQATGYQMQAEDNYQRQLSDLARQRMALSANKAQNAGNLMEIGGTVMGAAADLGAMSEAGKAGETTAKAAKKSSGISDLSDVFNADEMNLYEQRGG